MKFLTLLIVLFCQSSIAGSPIDAVNAFRKGIKEQKFADVWKHTAQFDGASAEVAEYLKSRVERYLKASADGWDFEIIEEKIKGDCAVVVLNESVKAGKKAFDIDPAFLIKQNGEWKVMPVTTDWDLSKRIPVDKQPVSMKLDEVKTAAYKELSKWFDERKAALKKERAK